jgi:tRNA nucleotidyltransferase (CCA-adding enzyme)
VKELSISGRELIQMGYSPGPEFGELLDHLLDRTLEDPRLNTTGLLSEEARQWMAEKERSHS